MARLPFVDPAALPEQFRSMAMRQNFQRVYANSPSAMQAFMAVTTEVRNRSPLDVRLRELAILQVGRSAKSPYVFTHHVHQAIEAGASADDVRAVGSESAFAPADPLTAGVIVLARDMTSGEVVDERVFESLRSALGDLALMDLLFVIAHYIGMATLLRTLAVELEDDYRKYLPYVTWDSA